jgi:hypothetical protein
MQSYFCWLACTFYVASAFSYTRRHATDYPVSYVLCTPVSYVLCAQDTRVCHRIFVGLRALFMFSFPKMRQFFYPLTFAVVDDVDVDVDIVAASLKCVNPCYYPRTVLSLMRRCFYLCVYFTLSSSSLRCHHRCSSSLLLSMRGQCRRSFYPSVNIVVVPSSHAWPLSSYIFSQLHISSSRRRCHHY